MPYVTANIIAKHIASRFFYGFKIGQAIKPVISFLKRQDYITGFKVKCKGRFSKKQRKSILVFNYGVLNLSSSDNFLDYNMSLVVLKFSVCAIKV